MFALRRAASRAVFTQPVRQFSSLRTSLRKSPFEFKKPVLSRSLHQSWRCLAEENEKPKEEEDESEGTSAEEVVEQAKEFAEDTAQEIQERVEQTAEEVQERAEQTAEQAGSTLSNAADQAQGFASSAAGTVQNMASSRPQVEQDAFRRNGQGRSNKPPPAKIIYVGNLFFEVTEQQLRQEFGQFGEIEKCVISKDNRGLSRGFAHIEFATQGAADAAIREQDQRAFQGRRMAVQYNRPSQSRAPTRTRTPNPPYKTLYIGNLSYQMSDRDLNDLFKDVKNVLDVRVAIDRRSGQPRGFAHADFVDVESATQAKSYLESQVIYGRQLRVDFGIPSRQGPPEGQ